VSQVSQVFPKTDALIQCYWSEHARLLASGEHTNYRFGLTENGHIVSRCDRFIKQCSDPDLMIAFILVGVRLSRLMERRAPNFGRRFRYPELVAPFQGSPVPTRMFVEMFQDSERTINWRPVAVVKAAILEELGHWVSQTDAQVDLGEIDELTDPLEPWERLEIPNTALAGVSDLNQAQKDYVPVPLKFSETYPSDYQSAGLKLFQLIDPLAGQLDFSIEHRGTRMIGFNYSARKSFLLFNETKDRYIRCGVSYALNYFGKNNN